MGDAINEAGADQQVGSYVDRVLRRREEADERMRDVSEVYKEAHGLGFDKVAIRGLVNEQRKIAKDPNAAREAEEILDTYRAAYQRYLSHAHTREAAE